MDESRPIASSCSTPTSTTPSRPGRSTPVGSVSLGRARTNDIVLASPLVSRQHARLRFVESCWVIEAQSELGVWWRGGLRSRVALEGGSPSRSASTGRACGWPSVAPLQVFDAGSTMRFRPENLGILVLDAARRDKEVAEIVESDFFRHLEQRAAKLRDQEPAATTASEPDVMGDAQAFRRREYSR